VHRAWWLRSPGANRPLAFGFRLKEGETVAIAHLARAHQLSSYDAAYLELAIRRGLPLAWLDGKLKAAAKATGIQLYNVQ
jgi:predicted nucleic acid-binding protein